MVIAICVISHEWGHYFTARLMGIQVHEFAFGMGPTILQKRRGETIWSLRAFPIGGFVRLAGMDEERDGEVIDSDRTFPSKKPSQRLLVLSGGALVNILLAIILTALLLWQQGVVDLGSTRIGGLMPGLTAQKIGLELGDEIVTIQGHEVNNWSEMSRSIRALDPQVPATFQIRRDGNVFPLTAIIPVDPEYGVPLLGIRPAVVRYSLPTALVRAFGYSFRMGSDILRGIVGWMFQREKVDLTGPVGIAGLAGQAVRDGWWAFISFLAVINLHLGILNLFPFPALDGGRIIFVLSEMITRRKLPEKWENYIHLAGFVVLISLILFITWKDLVKIFIKG